jgi:group I intron endonuclease
MIGIYKITSIIDNKIYIGQSVDLKNRFIKYKYDAIKNQIKIYNSIKKYGYSNHFFEVVETIYEYNKELLTQREQYYIDYYKNLGYDLLNIRNAGNSGKHSEETKLKIGNSNKLKLTGRKLSQQHVDNIKKSLLGNKYRLGGKVSDETRLKMSNSHKGLKLKLSHCQNISNVKKKIILQHTMENKFINEFSCADEAVKFLNVKSSKHIRNCALGYKKSAYGFVWKYKN